jgi:hypothetical protein
MMRCKVKLLRNEKKSLPKPNYYAGSQLWLPGAVPAGFSRTFKKDAVAAVWMDAVRGAGPCSGPPPHSTGSRIKSATRPITA